MSVGTRDGRCGVVSMCCVVVLSGNALAADDGRTWQTIDDFATVDAWRSARSDARLRREFHHYTVGGVLEIESTDLLDENVESVTCRWCGHGDAIESQ